MQLSGIHYKIFRIKEDWPHLAIVVLLVFSVFVFCAPRTVVLGDDGYFILAAYFNGVAHPPGYPLYTILGKLVTLLPVGSVAFRVHLLSSLFGSLTCVFIWCLARILVEEKTCAYVAALGYGFSSVFWSQAIVAEVYTLNTLLFFGLLFFVFHYLANPESRASFFTVFVIYGLGLSNHWPLFILSTPALLIIMCPDILQNLRKYFTHIPVIIIGLTPYLWMIYSSQQESAVSFFGPITSFSDFWFYISREPYAAIDTSTSANIIDKLQFSQFIIHQTFIQFGIIGGIFILTGFIRQWRVWPRGVSTGLFAGYVCNTFVLIFLLGFNFDEVHRNVFQVYPLIAYGICGLWLALGMNSLVEYISNKKMKSINRQTLSVGLAVLLTGTIISTHLPKNYRANDKWAYDYANTILTSLPSNSIFIGASDYVMGPVSYLYKIEGVRNDLTIYSYTGQVLPNRLFHPIKTSWDEVNQIFDDLIRSSTQEIFYTKYLPHKYGNEMYGLYQKVLRDKSSEFNRAIINPVLISYFSRTVNAGSPRNTDEGLLFKAITYQYCKLLGNFTILSGAENESYKVLHENSCNNFYGLLAKIDFLLTISTGEYQSEIENALKNAEKFNYQSASVKHLALLEFYRGVFFSRNNDHINAMKSYTRSYEVWSSPENPAYIYLSGENAVKNK